MHWRFMWVLGVSVTTLAGVQACGSDGGAKAADKPDGSATDEGGSAGTGGSAAGGSSGTGGAGGTGTGGAAAPCDTAPCDAQISQLTSAIGALGAAFSIKSCCVNATTCGIDTSAFATLLGMGTLPPCLDPSALTLPPPTTTDSGTTTPPPITILDGGIIPVGNGGLPIQLDKSCPDITSSRFNLPGCCQPSGKCGGSTHTLDGAGVGVALECLSYSAVTSAAQASFGAGVTIPDDPNISCKYTAGGIPDSGTGGTKPDAATGDGGPLIDAGPDATKDARTD
jgi:hypothetical protein